MRERESQIEKYLCDQVTAAGGEVRKVKWIGRRGAPDRLVLLNGVMFVEVKRPGGVLEPHQEREHDRLRRTGCRVAVVDSYESVDCLLRAEVAG